MTWIVAGTSIFGNIGLFSDIQVTFSDGSTKDMLQKAFPISNFVAAGFAGSVKIGYQLIENLKRYLFIPNENIRKFAWEPNIVLPKWGHNAKFIFDNSDECERTLGSQILVAAVSPNENNGPIPIVYIYKFSWPHFTPIVHVGNLKHDSIGSGANVEYYQRNISSMLDLKNGMVSAEIGKSGGWVMEFGFGITRALRGYPIQGVSQHIHMILVSRGSIKVAKNDERIFNGDDPPILIKMPNVAESYHDFLQIANTSGITETSMALC